MEELFLSSGWDTGRVQDFVDTLRLGSDQHVVSPGGVIAIVFQFWEQGGITANTLLEDLGIGKGEDIVLCRCVGRCLLELCLGASVQSQANHC